MTVRRANPLTSQSLGAAWDWLAHHYAILAMLLLGALVANELVVFGIDVTGWDLMFVSGTVTFVAGLGLALQLTGRTEEMLTRLVDRGALTVTPEGLAALKVQLRQRSDQWASIAGILVAAAMLIAFVLAFGPDALGSQLFFTLASAAGGYVAGRFLGRAASYEGLGRLFKQHGVSLQVQPAHLDGAAGLKPIGDFLFFQAMLIAIPAAFLAIWWVLIPAMPQLAARYWIWRDPYLGLLAIALAFELLAFIVPMWSFHEEMLDQKQNLLRTADGLSQRVAALQTALADATTDQDRKQLKDQLATLTDRYWAIEQMPTWPLDPSTRKRFTLNNVVLFIPLVSQLANVSGIWSTLLKTLPDLIRGLSS